MNVSCSFGGKGSNINISQALVYGYKLQLIDDLKIELTSSIGYPNYFQIGIINSKFRASIPFATSEGSTTNFELFKVSCMVLAYLSYKGYHWIQRKNKKLR